MSHIGLKFLVLALLIPFTASCASDWVPKKDYDEDVGMLREYVDALERLNTDLKAENTGLRTVVKDATLVSKENAFYDQIARQVEAWLRTADFNEGDVQFDPKTGKWTLADDVLFSSGSYTFSSQGRELLKTFAAGYLDRSVRFRIVGHTDRDLIKKAQTKKSLPVLGSN